MQFMEIHNPWIVQGVVDLVFTSEPDMIDSVSVFGCLADSDYNILQWTVSLTPTIDILNFKSAYYSRHSKWSPKWLMSVEFVLLCMFQTILLMGNYSWLSSGTEYWISRNGHDSWRLQNALVPFKLSIIWLFQSWLPRNSSYTKSLRLGCYMKWWW